MNVTWPLQKLTTAIAGRCNAATTRGLIQSAFIQFASGNELSLVNSKIMATSEYLKKCLWSIEQRH